MKETNTRAGDGRRLVLGFDAGCTTCSDLAKRIKEIVGDALEVRSLHEPQVVRWRKQTMGLDAPWTPTLIEINGTVVHTYTGARMCAKLTNILGLVSTLRLAQTIVAARSTLHAGLPDAPATNAPPGYGINRGQFIRRLGASALAAGLAASSIAGLSSAASATNRVGASTRGLRDCFATAAERRQFNRAIELLAGRLRIGGNGTLQISDGRFADAVETGKAEGVPHEMFRELASSVDIANEQILEGKLRSSPELISPGIQQITGQETQSNGADAVSRDISAQGCRGRSGRSVHWWGIRMRLNSCQANTLIYYCTIEAGALALCDKIWVIPCKIAAFVLLVQCATFRRAAAPGRGIVIDKSWSLRLPRVYSQ